MAFFLYGGSLMISQSSGKADFWLLSRRLKSYVTLCFTPWCSIDGNCMAVILTPWKCFFTLVDIALRSILSFAITVNISRVRWLATNAPSRLYFYNIVKLILLQIERHLSYEINNPREEKRWITVFVQRDAYNFKPT